MVVTQTGMDTEMGKIADALANAQEGQTPLQRKLTQLSRILTRSWCWCICVLIFAVCSLLRAGRIHAGRGAAYLHGGRVAWRWPLSPRAWPPW